MVIEEVGAVVSGGNLDIGFTKYWMVGARAVFLCPLERQLLKADRPGRSPYLVDLFSIAQVENKNNLCQSPSYFQLAIGMMDRRRSRSIIIILEKYRQTNPNQSI